MVSELALPMIVEGGMVYIAPILLPSRCSRPLATSFTFFGCHTLTAAALSHSFFHESAQGKDENYSLEGLFYICANKIKQ